MNKNKYIIAISVGVVILLSIAIWYFFREGPPPQKGCKASPSDPGSCDLDVDCNAPNGQCYKDENGVCKCQCSEGFSGPNCKTSGIPYDSPHCMGPNSQWPARKDKNGLCVCPVGTWASGEDPKYGYVQCLKCGGDWGPLSGDSPCQKKWMESNLVTTNCYGPTINLNTSVCNRPDEFGFTTGQIGPNGEKGSSVYSNQKCSDTEGCRCQNLKFSAGVSRPICNVSGWQNPSVTNQTCAEETGKARPCSGYKCVTGSGSGLTQIGTQKLKNLTLNNTGQLCGIDNLSGGQGSIWCTNNYKDGNAAVWTKSASKEFFNNISLADNGYVVGNSFISNAAPQSVIAGDMNGPFAPITPNSRYQTLSSGFTVKSGLMCYVSDDKLSQCSPHNGVPKNIGDLPWYTIQPNNRGQICGVTKQLGIQCVPDFNAPSTLNIPTPNGEQVTGGAVSLNNNGLICAGTSSGVYCANTFIGTPNWTKVDGLAKHPVINDKGTVCGTKADGTVWCKL